MGGVPRGRLPRSNLEWTPARPPSEAGATTVIGVGHVDSSPDSEAAPPFPEGPPQGRVLTYARLRLPPAGRWANGLCWPDRANRGVFGPRSTIRRECVKCS